MRIIFVCSSLEPGRDGAGDQARILAIELIRRGHDAYAVSLNESNLNTVKKSDQGDSINKFNVLQIPGKIQPKLKYKLLADLIKEVRPEWVSIQFVNFGYNRYGLPWEMLFFLKPALGKTNLHIMFQELWCGGSKNSTFKVNVLGKLQRVFIRLMLTNLKPLQIFTNTKYCENLLSEIGAKVTLAPVFSNVPMDKVPTDNDWYNSISASGFNNVTERSDDWFIVGFFGTIYPCPGIEALLAHAAEAASQLGRKFGILQIGHGRGIDIKSISKKIPDVNLWITGSLSLGLINQYMTFVNLGVVTSASNVINKSSTAGAWLERAIPVLISGQDETYVKSELEARGIFQVTSALDVLKCFEAKINLVPKSHLDDVASTYEALNSFAKHNIPETY